MTIKFGVVVVSDTASKDPSQDRAHAEFKKIINEFQFIIIPDETSKLQECIENWCDKEDAVDVLITSGGTGFTSRDITPETTKKLLDKEAPALQCALTMNSLQKTPMAMLSRGVCGIRKGTLIINFPGSPKAISECWSCIEKVLPHAVDQLRAKVDDVKSLHKKMQSTDSSITKVNNSVGCSCFHKEDALQMDRKMKDLDLSAPVSERPRHSPYPILSVDKALDIVLRECSSMNEVENIPWEDALGRILAEDLYALEAVPPYPASIKDGYAVLASDGAGERLVVGCHNAGDEGVVDSLQSGSCCRISTGAALPPGADSVVQVEDTELMESTPAGEELRVKILIAPNSVGQDVRPEGSDIQLGQLILRSGTVLGPAELGVIASAGHLAELRDGKTGMVPCRCRPVIGVLSTGNEVADACARVEKQPLTQTKIRDCNRITLLSTIRSWGYRAMDLGIADDTVKSIENKLASALASCDVVITSGGVSMGEKDLLKPIIEERLRGQIHFGRIFMKPGKPTTFATIPNSGRRMKKSLIFALPGNPVSALVTCHLFVRPALKRLCGLEKVTVPFFPVKLKEAVKLDPRPEYQRNVIQWPQLQGTDKATDSSHSLPLVYNTGNQISSRILSMHGANVLVLLPPAKEGLQHLPAGSIVSAMSME